MALTLYDGHIDALGCRIRIQRTDALDFVFEQWDKDRSEWRAFDPPLEPWVTEAMFRIHEVAWLSGKNFGDGTQS